MQDFRSELKFGAMQIVFAQNQAERLDTEKISAAGIAQNVAPSAGSLDVVAASPSHRRSAAGVNDNAVAVLERCGQTRITVAAGDDFGIGPDIEANFSERAPVFFCSAAGEENSCPADFLRQLGENRAQTLGRGEPKIRRWQFSLFEGGPLRPGVNVPGYNFNEHPGGFRSTAFDAENALAWFHDPDCRAGAPPAASFFMSGR